MRALVVFACVVLLFPLTASALPLGFMIPGPVSLEPGMPAIVPILLSGGGEVSAMNLVLEVSVPFEILDLQPGPMWPPIWPPIEPPPLPPQVALLSVVSPVGIIHPAGSVLAMATVRAPAGTAIGTQGTISTESPTMGVASDFGFEPVALQGLATLMAVPEPATAMLLLLGGGLALCGYHMRSEK